MRFSVPELERAVILFEESFYGDNDFKESLKRDNGLSRRSRNVAINDGKDTYNDGSADQLTPESYLQMIAETVIGDHTTYVYCVIICQIQNQCFLMFFARFLIHFQWVFPGFKRSTAHLWKSTIYNCDVCNVTLVILECPSCNVHI